MGLLGDVMEGNEGWMVGPLREGLAVLAGIMMNEGWGWRCTNNLIYFSELHPDSIRAG